MMDKKIYGLLGIGGLMVVGIVILMTMQTSTTPAPQGITGTMQEQPGEAPQAPRATVVRISEQNNSGQEGIAVISESNGEVRVEFSVSGAVAGVAQPAHIHSGTCAALGAVVYPLSSVQDGLSETTLSVSADALVAQVPLAINVHKSSAEVGVYVACGDILAF